MGKTKATRTTKFATIAFALLFVVSLAGFSTASSKDVFDKAPAVLKDTKEKAPESKEGHDKKPAAVKEHHAAAASHDTVEISAEDALKKLKDGNKRYLSGKPKNPGRSAERRSEAAKGQHPFAVVLGCSDSRVPPEVIFDQGVGDLFVIRTAGHVADKAGIGSIEYAVEHLGVRLVFVLGHKRCGAVDATVKGGEAPGNIRDIVEAIKPAVEKAKDKHGDLLDNAIRANVKRVAQQLAASKPILAEMIEDGVVRVVGGYYDIDSGAVSITYILFPKL